MSDFIGNGVPSASSITTTNIKDFLCITSSQYDSQIASIIEWWEPVINGRLTVTDNPTVFMGKLLYICYFVKSVLPAKLVNAFSGKREITQGNVKIVTQTSDVMTFDFLVEAEKILKPYYTADYSDDMPVLSSNMDVALEFSLERVDSSGNVINSGTMKEW